MQSTILILMLALGLPGANSCNAQQQGLPRVGQTPPAPATGQQPPALVDRTDGDEDDDADDDSDAEGRDFVELNAEEIEIELPAMDSCGSGERTGPGCTEEPCEHKCASKGAGSCQGQSGSCQSLGGDELLSGRVLHLKQPHGDAQTLSILPGSSVIVRTKNGKQVVLRAQGPGAALATTDENSFPTLDLLFNPSQEGAITLGAPLARPQAMQQPQDERVRELEQRVRELEAQLRERDGQRARSEPWYVNPRGSADFGEGQRARAEAEELHARARAMGENARNQARDFAEQARRQAEDIRQHSEELRKRVQEQAHVHARDMAKWHEAHSAERGSAWARAPRAFVEVHPDAFGAVAPAAPEPAELPDDAPPLPSSAAPEPSPFASGAWRTAPAPSAPQVKAFRMPKPPKPARLPGAASSGHTEEMKAMLDQVRAQMEELREQMKALREELQNAPQRELR